MPPGSRGPIARNLDFLGSNLRWLGAGFLLTLFSSFGQTFFIGLSGAGLREKFGLSDGDFGLLYMVATLASAMTLPWLGRTLDLMPGWKVARFSLPALAVACLLVPFAPLVAVLGVALYLLRLFGQGMMLEIAFTETGRWFDANRGRAMALVGMGLQAGTGIFPAVFVLVSGWADWRAAWIAAAAVLLFFAFPLIVKLMKRERIPQHHDDGLARARTARDWTRTDVIRDPVLYMLLAGLLAPPFIGTIVFFHLAYLIELRGYDPLVFAGAFPVQAITTVVFALVCGHLVDRFEAARLLPFYLLPLAAASAILAFVESVWGIYLFMFLLGISNGFSQTTIGSLWPEVYGIANLGGIRAIVFAAMVLATAAGPGLTGLLIDQGTPLPEQMAWMTGWCLAASLLLALAAARITQRKAQETSSSS